MNEPGVVCHMHAAGVAPGTPPFFCAECRVCQIKLARGLVTGKEPRPVVSHRRYKPKGSIVPPFRKGKTA